MNNIEQIPKEVSFIPFGPFKLRLPFIHYRLEKVEFIQGLIIGATALASLPYIMDYLGLSYELAYSLVIIETFLYTLHATLGDPVVPGWITASLPLTLSYLATYNMGPERIQAMIALQLMVAFLFVFMSVTKIADKFINQVPNSIKGGILLATPITVVQDQLKAGGGFEKFPLSLLAGFGLLIIISYSKNYKEKRTNNYILDIIAKYGNLFPYLLAMLVGILLKELPYPTFDFNKIIMIPQFKELFNEVSIFSLGIPPFKMFVKAIPLALVAYIISFGDFITTETLVKEAQKSRNDEIIEFNSSRSNLIIGIRNTILAIFAPFPPFAGPLWAGLTVSITQRYKEGKDAMKTLIGGMGSFRLATFLCVLFIPITNFMKPIFSVGGSITLLFQGFVCARIGMDYCITENDKMIAGFMAVILSVKGAAWGLLIGTILNIVLNGTVVKIPSKQAL